MLEKRNSLRNKMVLAVKVSLDETTHLVHTVDITEDGAQIGGLRGELHIGKVVSLQRGRRKANFRIVWVRELAPNELRAGVECLEPQTKFWGLDLPERERTGNRITDAIMTVFARRR